MTPRLSSYWLYFVTSTSYKLAVNLVDSMKVEVICRENNLDELLGIERIPYETAVKNALDRIDRQQVDSSWTDAASGSFGEKGISGLAEVPLYGCYKDSRTRNITDEIQTLNNFWTIGGNKGWYYANWLWGIRGFLDKLAGGVGLRRGAQAS
jgi:hypothetical protein